MPDLFPGAPPEPEVAVKPRGKILRWRPALVADVMAAVDSARMDVSLSGKKNKTNKMVLRAAKKMFPKWCKRRPYQVKLFNRMLREALGMEEKSAQDMALYETDLEF